LVTSSAYVLAYALGEVCVLKHPDDPTPGSPAAAAPMPDEIITAWREVGDEFLGSEWHVVFKGKRMGLFPSW
jgi:hypothetical protein